jgi:hypothetical protein
MEGRTVEAKKGLIHLLFQRIELELGILHIPVEADRCSGGKPTGIPI